MRVNLFLILVFGLLVLSVTYAPQFTTVEINNGIVNVTQNITLFGSTDHYREISLDDIEPVTHNAIISVYGWNGDLLDTMEIAEGKSLTKTIAGDDITITVHKTAASSVGPTQWANITVNRNAATAGPFLPIIQYLANGSMNSFIAVDDIEVGTGDAILDIQEWPSGISHVEKVKEGANIVRNISGKFYKITVMQTSGAQYDWYNERAKIKVEPATSGKNFDNYSYAYTGGTPLEYTVDGHVTKIRLDDIETETRSAIISILDDTDTLLAQEKIKEGQTLVRAGDGAKFKIKVIQVAAGTGMMKEGYRDGSWTKFDITNTTAAESPNNGVTIQMGDGQWFPDGHTALVFLNDFEKDSRKAMVTLIDAIGANPTIYEKIGEGQTFVRAFDDRRYSVKVWQTATGYSYFNTTNTHGTWAKITYLAVSNTTPVSPAVPPAEMITNGGLSVLSDDGNLEGWYGGVESPSHDLSLRVADLTTHSLIGNERVKEGGTVVKNVSTGLNYAIKVYQTGSAYYNPSNSWAKVNVSHTTATPSVVYTLLDAGVWWPLTYCPSPASMYIELDGLQAGTHYPMFSVYETSTGFNNLVIQSKLKPGSTWNIKDPTYGNCSVKVVQAFDDPTDYPRSTWAKLVVQ